MKCALERCGVAFLTHARIPQFVIDAGANPAAEDQRWRTAAVLHASL